MNWFNLVGLILSFSGALLAAVSVGSYPNGGHVVDEKGRRTPLAHILYPRLLRFGIAMVIIGFAIQIIPASYFLWQR